MRGQIDYPVLLVAVVLVASSFLVVQTLQKTAVLPRGIGEVQGAVVGVNADVVIVDSFVTVASEKVLAGILDQLKNNPGRLFSTVDEVANCVVLNAKESPRELFESEVQSRLSRRFNEGLEPYLAAYAEKTGLRYSQGSFEVGVVLGKFVVVAVRPFIFDVLDDGGVVVGEASHRPAFEVVVDHKLEKLSQAREKLAEVASVCGSGLPDSLACAVSNAPAWNPTALDNDKVMFIADASQNQPCYILFLPSQSTQSEAPLAVGEVQG